LSEKHLHIVSFDIPYPPNYGGVIDVFYKIRELYKNGVHIHLHCFEYPGRARAAELEKYCEKLHYYRRMTGWMSALSLKPYIVMSRRSDELISNLVKDKYPVLFEGLHSCFYMDDRRLKNKFKIYRESNIEHRYYYNLFKVSKRFFSKLYFLIESVKLKWYQKVLRHAQLMLVVSQSDTDYLQGVFLNQKVVHLPSFHANRQINVKAGKGDYALYHGNIEVPENSYAVTFLLKEVFNDIDFPLVIAGMNPPQDIKNLVKSQNSNIRLLTNPSDEELFDLIRNAQINILVTFQATGLKLKLLNTLYNGRHNLVNNEMIDGTPLAEICSVANNATDLKKAVLSLQSIEFDMGILEKRIKVLDENYSNVANAKKLIALIF